MFFDGDFFFNFLDKKVIELIFFLLFHFLSFWLIFNLTITHFLFKLNFSLIFFFFFFLSLIIKSCLLFLKLIVFFLFSFFSVFFSFFFLHLFIKLFFYFLLELLLSHPFKLLFFFKKLSIKFNKSGPFVIIISLNLINRLWSNWTCFRSFWTSGRARDLTFLIILLNFRLWFLWRS